MSASDFWSNRERAQADVEEVSRLRSLINPFRELEREIDDFEVLQQLATEEQDETHRVQAGREVATEHDRLIHKLEEFELRQFLSGENDRSNAFLTIHSGAGGTESCDWADMLLRMYQRWIERNGFKSQMVDVQTGEEVGIKSVTLLVTGEYAYGYLNTERGVGAGTVRVRDASRRPRGPAAPASQRGLLGARASPVRRRRADVPAPREWRAPRRGPSPGRVVAGRSCTADQLRLLRSCAARSQTAVPPVRAAS